MDDRLDFTGNPKHYKRYLDMCNSEAYQQLQRFYHRKTIFDILGVARQENPHSSFLAWLLNPFESHGMGEFPMKRFLETVCFAYSHHAHGYLKENNMTYMTYSKHGSLEQFAAEERLLFFDGPEKSNQKITFRKKLMQGDYHIISCGIEREKGLTNQRRADIYIDTT